MTARSLSGAVAVLIGHLSVHGDPPRPAGAQSASGTSKRSSRRKSRVGGSMSLPRESTVTMRPWPSSSRYGRSNTPRGVFGRHWSLLRVGCARSPGAGIGCRATARGVVLALTGCQRFHYPYANGLQEGDGRYSGLLLGRRGGRRARGVHEHHQARTDGPGQPERAARPRWLAASRGAAGAATGEGADTVG